MSKRFSLNKEDGKKILVGALMAIIGALLTYITETIGQVELGDYTPTVVAVWSIIANIARKYLLESK
jgi:hypothetical protein